MNNLSTTIGINTMSYRVITLCLEKQENAKMLTDVAGLIIGEQQCRVQTVHVLPSGLEYFRVSPYVQAIPLTFQNDQYLQIAAQIKSEYIKCQQAHPVRISWDWFQHEGLTPDDFTAYTRHAMVSDLVICAKPKFLGLASALPRALLTESAVPVLVIPDSYTPDYPFKRISIAWNETAESARAIRDALPLLKQAEVVVLVNFSDKQNDAIIKGSDVARYLGEHGINVDVNLKPLQGDIGSMILDHVSDNLIDLLVMGGFGHSSLYNLVFGAATPQVLNELDCPVLLSK